MILVPVKTENYKFRKIYSGPLATEKALPNNVAQNLCCYYYECIYFSLLLEATFHNVSTIPWQIGWHW